MTSPRTHKFPLTTFQRGVWRLSWVDIAIIFAGALTSLFLLIRFGETRFADTPLGLLCALLLLSVVPFAVVVLPLWLKSLRRGRVEAEVGVDGFTLRDRGVRYWSFADLREVGDDADGFFLVEKTGTQCRLADAKGRVVGGDVAAFVAAVRSGLARGDGERAPGVAIERLTRALADPSPRVALGGVFRSDEPYRGRTVSVDEAVSVVEDVRADLAVRAAAAYALSTTNDLASLARARCAVKGYAAPGVRDVLTRAADGSWRDDGVEA